MLIIGLLLSVSLAIPTVQAQELLLQVSIDEVIFEQGLIVVTGMVTCSEPTGSTNLTVIVQQPVGRFKSVQGFASDSPGPCAGELPFEVSVAPSSGSFKKQGDVFVTAEVFSCSETAGCDSDAFTDRFDLKQ